MTAPRADWTPGPWTTAGDLILDAGGEQVGAITGDRTTADQDDANAALIVRAVNCHEDLVAALEAMVDVQSRRKHPLGLPDEGISHDAADAASKARAALAKARGETP